VEDLQGRVMLLERRLQLLSEELSLILTHSPERGGPASTDAVNSEASSPSPGPDDGEDRAPFSAEAHIDADSISAFAHGFYPTEYDTDGRVFRWTGNGPLCELRFFIDRSTDRQLRLNVGDTAEDILSKVSCFVDYAPISLTIEEKESVNYLVGTVPKRAYTRLVVVSFLLGVAAPKKKSTNAGMPTWLGFKFYALDVS
jgi:hypothetical protein